MFYLTNIDISTFHTLLPSKRNFCDLKKETFFTNKRTMHFFTGSPKFHYVNISKWALIWIVRYLNTLMYPLPIFHISLTFVLYRSLYLVLIWNRRIKIFYSTNASKHMNTLYTTWNNSRFIKATNCDHSLTFLSQIAITNKLNLCQH